MVRLFSRYVAVQLVAYAIDFGAFLILSVYLGVGVVFSNVIAKLAAGGFAFVAHRNLTFMVATREDAPRQILKYAVLLALNIPIASAILVLLLPWLSPPALAKLAADIICVLITFALSHKLVFTSESSRGAKG